MAAPPFDVAPLHAVWRAAQGGPYGDRPLVVGFSGGGDSLALLALLRQAAPQGRLIALVVDHGLRPGSEAIAAKAAQQASALGAKALVHRLVWPPGGAPHDQARARQGRYQALAAQARAAGARVVAVAHTLDDQAETALIKFARTGRWGAAGMAAFAPLPLWPKGMDLTLARPLLAVRRQALRAFLRAEGLDWHEDAANTDQSYARARARALLQADAGLCLRLAKHGAKMAAAAAHRNALAQAKIAENARFDPLSGAISLPRLPQTRAERRAFAALMGVAAGTGQAAPSEGVGKLVALLRAGAKTACLAGALVRQQGASLTLLRDPGAILGRKDGGDPGLGPQALAPLPPFHPRIVDGRLWIEAQIPGYSICILPKGALGLRRSGHRIALNEAKGVTYRWLADAQVRHALPVYDPIASCDAAKGVQQALGLLS